jgi:hypothetical protein
MTFAKTRITGLAALFIAAGLVVTACDVGNFGDINEDPTETTEVDAELLVSRSIAYGTLRYDVYQRSQHLFGNLYSQYFSNLAPSFPTGRYETVPPYDDWATSFWNATYAAFGGGDNVGENVSNAGINAQLAIEQTKDNAQKTNITAQARIWKVYLLHRVADNWGDVPYTEAFGGLQGNTTPAYDEQEAIYRDMLSTLETAVSNLDPNITGERFRLGSADLLFNDDLTKWRRFGNSLRLRLAMRVAEAAPTLAEQHVNDVLTNGEVMMDNEDSARRPTTTGGDFVTQNPLSVITNFDDDRVSATMVDMLREHNDPRLSVYADTIGSFDVLQDTMAFRGLPNGLSAADISGIQSFKYSSLGPQLRAADFAVPVLLYPEVKFLEAEAALRGWGPGTAQQHYEEGILASLDMYGITDPQVQQDYLQEPGVAWNAGGTGAEQLEQIITQKWLATFTQGFQAWAEYRRTGYPDLQPLAIDDAQTETGGAVPSRLQYVNIEQATNTQNVNEASQRIGGNSLTTDVWWDQEQSGLVTSDGSE